MNADNTFGTRRSHGIAFVGAVIIGIAIGMFKHQLTPYMLLGVGAGFILLALFSLTASSKK